MPILGIIASGISGNLTVLGQEWKEAYGLPTSTYYYNSGYIVYGGGKWVCFGTNGIKTSTDLTTWTTTVGYPFSSWASSNNLVYDGSQFVCLNYFVGDTSYHWYTSSNGTTWTDAGAINLSSQTGGSVSPYYSGITYANGFYGVNGANSSGTGWWRTSNIATAPTFAQVKNGSVQFGYGGFAAGSNIVMANNGNQYAYSSNSGSSWSYATASSGGWTFQPVQVACNSSGRVYMPGTLGCAVASSLGGGFSYVNISSTSFFMAATNITGNTAMVCDWYTPYYAYTTNGGTSWTRVTLSQSTTNSRINYSNGYFFIYTSSTTQQVIAIPESNMSSYTYIDMGNTPIATNTPRWIFSNGSSGAIMSITGTDLVQLATGGMTGTTTSNVFNNGSTNFMSYQNGYWIASAGGDGYYYSTDKTSWTFVNGSGNPGAYGPIWWNGSIYFTNTENANYARWGSSIGSITNSNLLNNPNGFSCQLPALDSTGKFWYIRTGQAYPDTVGYYTTNGSTITQITLPAPTTNNWYRGFTVNGNKNILLSNGANALSWSTGDISTASWTGVTLPRLSTGYSLIYANGTYIVACLESPVQYMYSTNLSTWTAATVYPNNYWTGNGTRFSAVGNYNQMTYDGTAVISFVSSAPFLLKST